MSEDEAKALAAELEHHRYWRVVAVYENPGLDRYWPHGWVVQIEHRTLTGMCKWIYGLPKRVDVLAQILNDDGRVYEHEAAS